MSPQPTTNQAAQSDDVRSMSPEETPDIVPERILSGEEAEQDYQKQLALLAQQNAKYRAKHGNVDLEEHAATQADGSVENNRAEGEETNGKT